MLSECAMSASTSRVVRFHQLGGPEVLALEQRKVPMPAGAEVLIKVQAIGLNRADVLFRSGQYLEPAQPPSLLGFEAAGEVLALGPEASGFSVGDAVGVIPGFALGPYGTYADHIVIRQAYVVRQPEGLTPVLAAALWMAYLTAYGGLVEAGKLRSGDWVAINAASSSVGLAAIQVARHLGAKPIAITTTSGKRQALLEAGALAVIVTQEEPLTERLHTITGTGLACAFDAVGGPQVLDLALAMRPSGSIVIHGGLSPKDTPFPLKLAITKSLAFRGFVYTEITRQPEAMARAHAFISDGVRLGHLRPHIDRTFTLKEVREAHQHLESNQQFGKVVMVL